MANDSVITVNHPNWPSTKESLGFVLNHCLSSVSVTQLPRGLVTLWAAGLPLECLIDKKLQGVGGA